MDEENQQGEQEQQETQQTTTETPPAETTSPWQGLLDALPSSLHNTIQPFLEEADRNVQKGFERYAPYKGVLEYDPDILERGVALLNSLDKDPEQVYKAIADAYGFNTGAPAATTDQPPTGSVQSQPTGNVVNGVNLDDLDLDDPVQLALSVALKEINELKTNTQTLSQAEQQRQAEAEQARAAQELETTLKGLESKHGAFDRTFVLGYMAAGQTPEQAITAWKQIASNAGGNGNGQSAPPPPVMGSGGSIPSMTQGGKTPGQMSSKEVNDLVKGIVSAAQAE